MDKKSIFRRFLEQPLSICIAEIWIAFVVFVGFVQFPWFMIALFAGGFTVLSIIFILMYVAFKDSM